VLAQTFTSFELLIVDDGSTDDTERVVQSIGDPRVRYVAQQNRGPAVARNRGVELASAPIVTFLDSDDLVLPGWLMAMLEPFTASDADLVCCGVRTVREADGHTATSIKLPRRYGPAFNNMPGRFSSGAYALRQDVFARVGGFDPRSVPVEHTELALRLAELSEQSGLTVHAIPVPYLLRLHHGAGHLSRNWQMRLDGACFMIDRHRARLGREPRLLARYLGVAGVCAHRLRLPATASSCFLEAATLQPLSVKRWLSYVMSVTGVVPPWVWAVD
jgi:glycosyltransferase involved in cell wall biosynthesis